MITTVQTLPYTRVLPPEYDLASHPIPDVRQYAARVLDPESGDTYTVAPLLTIKGQGEVSLAWELAGSFGGEVQSVWTLHGEETTFPPRRHRAPGSSVWRHYWVVIERLACCIETGSYLESWIVDIGIRQGQGEIRRLQDVVGVAYPGWTLANFVDAEDPAEEF